MTDKLNTHENMIDAQTCLTCRWWNRHLTHRVGDTMGGSSQCRGAPPVKGDIESRKFEHRSWPHTWAEDWCGMHRPMPLAPPEGEDTP